MTQRERFRETLLFGKPDKIPFSPGSPRESTLAAWHSQGLPEGKDYYDALLEILEIELEPKESEIALEVSFQMIPKFEEKVLEHKNGHYIVQDWMGAITEISDKYDYTYIRSAKDFVTRKWHKFPVENEKDWEKVRERFDPGTPGRFPEDFEDRCKKLKDRDYILSIGVAGPFWQLREWCGFENLCMFMVEKPDFVQEMIGFWSEFVPRTIGPILKNIEVDEVIISEDMAYKEHSMVSPEMVRKFLLPIWKRWVSQIKKGGCTVVNLDSDGYVGELIPLWIEGGIDKRAIARGGKVIEKEVMRVVPPLLKDGGFIPSCDHGVPPDISWPDFIEYSRLLAKLTGWL